MKLQQLQGKCTDIVCDNESEFDAVVGILEAGGFTLWDMKVHTIRIDMLRIFSDGTYAPHCSSFAGSCEDSTVITAKEFIEENS